MVVPLKNKTGPTLVEAFKVILTSGRKPEKIMTDQGTEFLNRNFRALMKEEDIELYNTYNETKASFNTMEWWGICPTGPFPLPHH